MPAAASSRRLSTWLLCGLLIAPGAFVWFLLRRGYSNQLRMGGFVYAAVAAASGVVRFLELTR